MTFSLIQNLMLFPLIHMKEFSKMESGGYMCMMELYWWTIILNKKEFQKKLMKGGDYDKISINT